MRLVNVGGRPALRTSDGIIDIATADGEQLVSTAAGIGEMVTTLRAPSDV